MYRRTIQQSIRNCHFNVVQYNNTINYDLSDKP